MKKSFAYLLAFMLILALGASSLQAQTAILKRSVIGSGGMVGVKGADGNTMSGLMGQIAIEKITNGSDKDVYQGFWVPSGPDTITAVGPGHPIFSTPELLNYPNPFSTSTNIKFNLKATGYVTLKVYDVMGNTIKTLFTGVSEAGEHVIPWDGKDSFGQDVSSGSYLYELVVQPAQLAGPAAFNTFSLRNMMVIVK